MCTVPRSSSTITEHAHIDYGSQNLSEQVLPLSVGIWLFQNKRLRSLKKEEGILPEEQREAPLLVWGQNKVETEGHSHLVLLHASWLLTNTGIEDGLGSGMVAMTTGVGGSLGVGTKLGGHRMSVERAGRTGDTEQAWVGTCQPLLGVLTDKDPRGGIQSMFFPPHTLCSVWNVTPLVLQVLMPLGLRREESNKHWQSTLEIKTLDTRSQRNAKFMAKAVRELQTKIKQFADAKGHETGIYAFNYNLAGTRKENKWCALCSKEEWR